MPQPGSATCAAVHRGSGSAWTAAPGRSPCSTSTTTDTAATHPVRQRVAGADGPLLCRRPAQQTRLLTRTDCPLRLLRPDQQCRPGQHQPAGLGRFHELPLGGVDQLDPLIALASELVGKGCHVAVPDR